MNRCCICIFIVFLIGIIIVCYCVYWVYGHSNKLPADVIKYENVTVLPSDGTADSLVTDCTDIVVINRHRIKRIIGGSDISPLEHPWLALLSYVARNGTKYGYGCGGTLINKRYVLTAGHCLKTFLDPDIFIDEVTLGIHNTNITNCTTPSRDCIYPPQRIKVEEISIHTRYYGEKYEKYDIGLVRLAEDVNTTLETVRPVCLMKSELRMKKDELYTVAGWGYTKPNQIESIPLTPKRVLLPRVYNEICKMNWKDKIHSNNLCAGGRKGEDACTGDSGNPLLRHINGMVYAEGIVSGGLKNCGQLGIPGIYMYIPRVLDWIKYNLRK